ncbi:MAG: glycosyltransferase [Comamonadaceae bacterium CG_4_10_14_3_um_filter_60_42]|nr:MAG: glycosyltransferase [Comamonadaceae bacterium CG_4_10_14_3_um_filter_60_42]
MKQPLITIIIAVYNAEGTIQQCIDSIVNQTYKNKEIIIVDGASSDNTVALLRKNAAHLSYWVSEPDSGVYNAFNKGLKHASGEWIYFLGADDYFWNDCVLEEVVKRLMTTPANIKIAYGCVMLVNDKNENILQLGKPWNETKKIFSQLMNIPHQGVMHRRSLFEIHGVFDESFKITGDYEMLLRELKTNDALFIDNSIIAGYRQGGISSVSANALRVNSEYRRAQKLNGLNFPGLMWISNQIKIYTYLFLFKLVNEKNAKKMLDLTRKIRKLPPYWEKL